MRKLQGDRVSVKCNLNLIMTYLLIARIMGALSLEVCQILIGHYFMKENNVGIEDLHSSFQS